MSGLALQSAGIGSIDGVDGIGGVDGGNSTNQIIQLLEELIQEMEEMLDLSSQSSGGGGGGSSAPAPTSFATDPASGSGGGGGGGSGGGGATSGVGGDGSTSGGSNSGTLPTNLTGNFAQDLTQDLESRYGLNSTQVAGVLGNLQQESGLQTDINQGGATGGPSSNFADNNENGWGVAQWGGQRKAAEISYAQQNGVNSGSEQAQIGFINQELDTDYSNTVTDLKGATTTGQAAQIWDQDYEQASDPQMGNRDQYAQQFLSEGL
ncbi:phage tail tip lysozyme [Paraburkholderia acidipaludis]|uniref:phage tail tip lysozyme n=1 Tax=Paraburkholderia acidipaludis TaxID=660537 RepID=UPI000485C806|nr:phage tail tip lysozyme [Paraburkholderia acidipaludis]